MTYAISGVNVWSFATWNVNVRGMAIPSRVERSVIVIGIVVGILPSVPAIAVARSCWIVPMISPMLEILNDDIRLGSIVCTYARVSGSCDGPRLKNG